MTTELWLELMRLDDLVPALRNPRAHDIEELRRSVRRFGFTVAPQMDERTGRLVAGHGRCQLLRLEQDNGRPRPEGIEEDADGKWLVPTIRGWSSENDAEASAYLITDNRQTEITQWETLGLHEALARLQGGAGLEGVGFDADDVDDLYAKLQETAPSAPEGPPNTRNQNVKSLVLDYPLDDYGYVAATAHRARAEFGVESNAELFLAMLRADEEEHAE